MSIACTFPGKFGDILWAMATVRAISETYDEPVNLIVAEPYGSIVPLLALQPYIQHAEAFPLWKVLDTAPMSPRIPPTQFNFDRVFHLGYQGWPMKPLPEEIHLTARVQYEDMDVNPLDLHRPWITVPRTRTDTYKDVIIGFTDEWFELKYGVYELIRHHVPVCSISGTLKGSRWHLEGSHSAIDHEVDPDAGSWMIAAKMIQSCAMFLGCCSAYHVLSAALGKTTIVMEPNPNRHHPIFWPYGIDNEAGPVICVKGGDGKPTFDARHVRDAIVSRLHTVPITL